MTKEQLQTATDALEEAIEALHDKDENHPVLTRPDWSKQGVNLWVILSNLRLECPTNKSPGRTVAERATEKTK